VDPARADEVFVAALEARPGSRNRQRLRVLGAFVAELAWGLLPRPSVSDLVVRRRDSGVEVLRLEAGDPHTSGDLLRQAREAMGRLSPAAFEYQWGLDRP